MTVLALRFTRPNPRVPFRHPEGKCAITERINRQHRSRLAIPATSVARPVQHWVDQRYDLPLAARSTQIEPLTVSVKLPAGSVRSCTPERVRDPVAPDNLPVAATIGPDALN